MTPQQKSYLEACGARYKADLLSDVMPFWLSYGLDMENGGVYTCLDRDGGLMDSTKSVWFQGRFAYVCSLIYNRVSKEQKYLDAAKMTLDFIEAHCFDSDGHMFFEVSAKGEPIRRRRYVFSECFAIIAMAEYALATGQSDYAQKAVELLRATLKMLDTPDFLPAKYMPGVKMQGLSVLMILLNTANVVKQVAQEEFLDELVEDCLVKIEKYFVKEEFKAVLECVGENGELIDTCSGRVINPGHSIELAWFILEATASHPRAAHYRELALKIFDWSWQWGWDEECGGGIINFKDCKGFPPQDYSQDMKFWWPQCETIIASLMAYRESGDEKYLKMHSLSHDWTFAHFPDQEHGEWYGYLHRDGSAAQRAKGNIFKGPFHIPRMMVVASLLCEEIASKE